MLSGRADLCPPPSLTHQQGAEDDPANFNVLFVMYRHIPPLHLAETILRRHGGDVFHRLFAGTLAQVRTDPGFEYF